MKISDSTTTPTFIMSSPLLMKKNKSMKPFKFNRRLKNRMATLSKTFPANSIPINNLQITSMPTLWTNTQQTSPKLIATPIHINTVSTNISTPSTITSSSTYQSTQNTPVFPLHKPFSTPRITTTLIPLNVCPVEYCETMKSTPPPTSSVNIIENHQNANVYVHKSKSTVATHLIGDWIIRESSEPFQRKENQRSSPIEQLVKQEKKIHSNESIHSSQSSLPNVKQWTTDDVCSFFERVLGKNCYTPIIKEHLIDGTALLLLQDEHLISIFKMQLGPRLKLLNHINKLKTGDTF